MAKLTDILKGGLLVSGAKIGGSLASFGRNIIVARLVSVEDFGVAALFALTMSFIELGSNFAVTTVIVQDREGNKRRMQATAHSFQFVRGLICGIALFVAAPYVAAFSGFRRWRGHSSCWR
nr:oligosaccharide flippase family protein [Alkalilimnicola ehrlichii]